MAELSNEKIYNEIRKKLLLAAAELFLTKGFKATKMREIEEKYNIERNDLIRIFGSKENILADLVKYVLEEQFRITKELLKGKTEDKTLYYALETALQLHIVESSEHIRELYATAYSLPNTTHIIQETLTSKLEELFKEYLPTYETVDFYMLEIATGGIMRGFITVPCNLWFTIDKKVKAFLETSLSLYKLHDKKIKEAIDFVLQFDLNKIAQETIQAMLETIEEKG